MKRKLSLMMIFKQKSLMGISQLIKIQEKLETSYNIIKREFDQEVKIQK